MSVDSVASRFSAAPLSHWRQFAPSPSNLSGLSQNKLSADVVVVGLGAPGLLAAGMLAAAGATVIGVDAGAVGRGAAGANGGFLLSGGNLFLHNAIFSWGAVKAKSLWVASSQEFDREMVEFAGTDIGLRRCGSLRTAGHPFSSNSDGFAAEVTDLGYHASALRNIGVAYESSTLGDAPALFVPGDGWVDPARRVNELARRAFAAGVTIVEHTPVLGVTTGLVRTALADIKCEHIIVCVDGHLEDLFPGLPVQSHRLQMLSVSNSSHGRLAIPTYMRFGFEYGIDLDPACHGSSGFTVGGFRDRHAVSETAASFTGPAVPSHPVQQDLETLATHIAGTPVTVINRWAASVSYTASGWPLVCQPVPGVWAVGGLSGHGNLIGPLAARAIASTLLAERPPAGSSFDAGGTLGWLAS